LAERVKQLPAGGGRPKTGPRIRRKRVPIGARIRVEQVRPRFRQEQAEIRQTAAIRKQLAEERLVAAEQERRETIEFRAEREAATAAARQRRAALPKTAVFAGIVRIFVILIVLSLLLLVLRNPGSGVALAGGTKTFLDNFLTVNPKPLFKER